MIKLKNKKIPDCFSNLKIKLHSGEVIECCQPYMVKEVLESFKSAKVNDLIEVVDIGAGRYFIRKEEIVYIKAFYYTYESYEPIKIDNEDFEGR